MVLVQNLKKFILGDLISNTRSLLKLTVLLTESLVESGYLHFIVIHEGLLLLHDHLVQFTDKAHLACIHRLLALMENLAHHFRKVLKILFTVLSSFSNFVLEIPKITFEIIEFEQALVNEVILRSVHVVDTKGCEP